MIALDTAPHFSKAGRVRRSNPCPICGRTDWCGFSDNELWLKCMRSDQARAGWLFVKETRDGGFLFKHEDLPRSSPSSPAQNQPHPKLTIPPKNQPHPKLVRRKKPQLESATEILSVPSDHLLPLPSNRFDQSESETVSATGFEPLGPVDETLLLPPTSSDHSASESESVPARANRAALASPAERAAAINWLISKLSLSPAHRSYLLKEGFDLSQVQEKLGYRTLVASSSVRQRLLKELEQEFGREVARSLGFVYERRAKNQRPYLCFAGVLRETEALLIPVRDVTGQPIALKARSVLRPVKAKPHPIRRTGVKEEETFEPPRQYRVMSAGNTELGVSVGVPVHVARPITPADPELAAWVIITEGEKKADYVAEALGVTALGVQGVGNWRAGEVLKILAQLGARVVVEAYDQDEDAQVRQRVARQARELCEQCAGAGYRVFSASWSATIGKGLDDFLRNATTEQMWELHRFGPSRSGATSAPAQANPDANANTDTTTTTNATTNNNEAPAVTEEETALNEAFQRRYGIRRQRVSRVKGEFVKLDKATLDSLELVKQQRQAFLLRQAEEFEATLLQEYTIEEARQELAAIFQQTFHEHIEGNSSRLLLLRTTTGTGKTHAAIEQLKQHLQLALALEHSDQDEEEEEETAEFNFGEKSRVRAKGHHKTPKLGRVLYATDTKQAYEGLVAPGGELYPYLVSGQLMVQQGRTPNPTSPYYCKRFEECRVVGENRQPASADVCSDCPFSSSANWQKYRLAQAGGQGKTASNLAPADDCNQLDAEAEGDDGDERASDESGFTPSAMPWKCREAGYLATVERAKKALVIIAPKAAILNASETLGEFDLVIIDEDCVSYLLEKQSLTVAHLHQWWQGRRRLESEARQDPARFFGFENTNGNFTPEEEALALVALDHKHALFDRLLELVGATLVDFSTTDPASPERVRFLPVLEAKAKASGKWAELRELVQECASARNQPGGRYQRYGWERPYRDATTGELVAPLRLAKDFIQLLARELELNEPGADTQLWLERHFNVKTAQMETSLVVYLPRQHLLDYLNGTASRYLNHFGRAPSVVFLDATAGIEFRLAIPQAQEKEIKVKQPLHLIQLIDSLYTPATLNREGNLAKISRTIARVAQQQECQDVVVFSRMAYNPDAVEAGRAELKLNVNLAEPAIEVASGAINNNIHATGGRVRYGHFERHNKGLNDYAGSDLIAIVGHYSQPIAEIEARVMALRRSATALADRERHGPYGLRRYEWRNHQGEGLARWCRQHPDPLIQQAIEHSSQAAIMQTIGRGRAALRQSTTPGLVKPLIVLLFTSLPVEGLKIDELTNRADLLEEARITQRQRAALEAGRQQHNAHKHAEAVASIEATRAALAAEGQEWVAPGRFAARAGVSRATLYRLGYAHTQRWVRVQEIPGVYPLEVFISFISTPPAETAPVSGSPSRRIEPATSASSPEIDQLPDPAYAFPPG